MPPHTGAVLFLLDGSTILPPVSDKSWGALLSKKALYKTPPLLYDSRVIAIKASDGYAVLVPWPGAWTPRKTSTINPGQ